ncbi:class I SAM-dependent DNA methyltransferase [Lapidilactobacillus wuchangensis]|uniref:class I SAM-dependent DNA methyltransferase n=1 Tax=Lapidilactobacillus wuchangensis TaxID=2486001 RepID=UPI000F7ACAAC|nr:class I SAM-dependent methyltransferase [Lapidilactobacillus wuchangensis]
MYQTFAYYYDQLMDKDLYQQWLDFTNQQFGSLKQQQVLDLACGTGDLALLYAQQGADVFGVDLSLEMLTLAADRLNKANADATLMQGDFRQLTDLELPQLDLVTCYDDSLCYLTNLADLQTTFEQVRQSLKPGGTFLFDMHSLYQVNEVFPGYMYNYHEEDWAFMWSSFADDPSNSVLHDLTFFVWRDDLGGYDALNEIHHERTYPIIKVKQALAASGFTEIETFGGFAGEAITPTTERWFFKAKAPQA